MGDRNGEDVLENAKQVENGEEETEEKEKEEQNGTSGLDGNQCTNKSSSDQGDVKPSYKLSDIKSAEDLMRLMGEVDGEEKMDDMGKYRQVFKGEMYRLHQELQAFKQQCRTEMVRYAKEVDKRKEILNQEIDQLKSEEERRRIVVDTSRDTSLSPDPCESISDTTHQHQDEEIKELKQENFLLEDNVLITRQQLLDQEAELLGREEELSRRQASLEEYEKEIKSIESFLDRRFEKAKEKEKAITELDEELEVMREEVEEKSRKMNNAVKVEDKIATAHKKQAQNNWDFLRKSLMDKQNTLEAALRRCKAELARAENTIEDLSDKEMKYHKEIKKKEKKIKDLETKLSLTLINKEMQEENNSKHSQRISLHGSPDTDSLRHSVNGVVPSGENAKDNTSNTSGSLFNFKNDTVHHNNRPETASLVTTTGSRSSRKLSKMDILRPSFRSASLKDREKSPSVRSVHFGQAVAETNGTNRMHHRAQSAKTHRELNNEQKQASQTCAIM